MNENIYKPISEEALDKLSRKQLLKLIVCNQNIIASIEKKNTKCKEIIKELIDGTAIIQGVLTKFKNKIFGRSSERSDKDTENIPYTKSKKRKSTLKLPSEKYPDAVIIDRDIDFVEHPVCSCCSSIMSSSGMLDSSEYLEVSPKSYFIIRQNKKKYRCKTCHSEIKTAPSMPRIKSGSSYSDNIIIDVALSKYCDLVPIGRYSAMAARQGFPGLPANSLIETTHHLADFVTPAVDLLKQEVLSLTVLMADETPHKMLEGSEKKNWYLWGFSGPKACYFECHDTRSGDIASNFLKDSKCEVLVTDVYSGYKKAIRETNIKRVSESKPEILSAYCNAHARRKFKECEHDFPKESIFYLKQYREIYILESSTKDKSLLEKAIIRKKMQILFSKMQAQAKTELDKYSSKSLFVKSLNYFLNNYVGLTRFIDNVDIPIDNNAQERNLRSPVIGRKTWYGTHSERGSETASKLFSLVESCKLNKVNPRSYFKELVTSLLESDKAFTPSEFAKLEKKDLLKSEKNSKSEKLEDREKP